VVQHGADLTEASGDAALWEAVASGNWGELPARMETLCRHAALLTIRPWEASRRDLEPLRAIGLTDRDIVDLTLVVAYFNFINRVADGLGVELEPTWSEQLRVERRYDLRTPLEPET
jgi:uncharacterized peroxidase-related enzyme